MARKGGDRVLESRHLVGLFLGVVLLCGVFFTLGYVMGHNQYGDPVHAAAVPERSDTTTRNATKTAPKEVTPPPPPTEWDFYHDNADNRLEPAPTPTAPKSSTAPAPTVSTSAPREKVEQTPAPAPTGHTVPASAKFVAPHLAKGAIVLQVAALRHESDALAMADALQQKNFPSFVVSPNSDPFYRVQVGPYMNDKAADSARAALEHAGFKAITKR